MNHASLCKKCNRNFLLEYEYEFTCYICGFIIEKTKNQLTKEQRKKKTNFLGRLNYAKPKIISICMDVDSITKSLDYDLLAAALTFIKQKKLNIIDSILEKFYDIPEEFETNDLVRKSEGIQKAGNYSLRMMKWLVSNKYYENINYFDLIGTALTFMKGEKLNVTNDLFCIINECI